jgi:hypothetical protein
MTEAFIRMAAEQSDNLVLPRLLGELLDPNLTVR